MQCKSCAAIWAGFCEPVETIYNIRRLHSVKRRWWSPGPLKYRLLPQEREIADFRITCLSTAAATSLEVVHSDIPASLNQTGNITYQREGCKIIFWIWSYVSYTRHVDGISPGSGRCVSARVSWTVMSWWWPEGQGLGGPLAMLATPWCWCCFWWSADHSSLRVKFSQGRTGDDTCHRPSDYMTW